MQMHTKKVIVRSPKLYQNTSVPNTVVSSSVRSRYDQPTEICQKRNSSQAAIRKSNAKKTALAVLGEKYVNGTSNNAACGGLMKGNNAYRGPAPPWATTSA